MNLMIRAVIIYVVVILAVRLMGKRQIGELQPGELVITILLSEVASMPLQGDDYPLMSSVVLIFLFVALEVISSVLSLKSRKYRTIIQGHSIMIIKDGELLQDNLKMIRYSIDDLFESLRQKDVFDIKEIKYAYVETNGAVSVELKNEYKPPTANDLNLSVKNEPLPCLVISDGQILTDEFYVCKATKKQIENILKKKNLKLKDVLVMTLNENGESFIVKKTR